MTGFIYTAPATLSFGATVAMGVAAGAVGGFANAYGMTTLAGKSTTTHVKDVDNLI